MAKKNKKFKTEVKQLLDLVIHSLYTKKEIYLRELLSNASDAIDRARYEGLTDKSILANGDDFKIKITADKDAKTITIADNGIGMSLEEIEKNIGTIASSGTKKFLENLKESQSTDDHEFIGQFGVGFYSAFMVADKVTVETLRRGKGQQAYRWESGGTGSYTIEEVEKDAAGTSITLHLRDDMSEYLEQWQVQKTVKQYSDYISYPICMDVTRTEYPEAKEGEDEKPEPYEVTEEQTLNSMKAIWRRSKSDVTEDEYKEFYKHVSHDFGEPMETIHFKAEGVTEFQALLYIPAKAPFDMVMSSEKRQGIHLYVKNVFITDDCRELLPDYMRFVRGVVDSTDLPLNVSREMLQDDAIIRRIHKNLVKRVLRDLGKMQENRKDDYYSFWKEFGRVFKEGLHFDFENREKLQDLVLFPSTMSEPDKPTSLKEYVGRMPESQQEIFYVTGDNLEALKDSPHLEALKEKGYEVLFYADPIDEWVSQALTEYDGKKFKAIDRGDLELDTEDEKKKKEKVLKKAEKQFLPLVEFVQDKLKGDVKEVKLSTRMTDSACCLVADQFGMNANMERIMKSMGQEYQPTLRTLELNYKHPLMKKMKGMFEADKDDPALADYCELLLDQALMTEGSPVRNPAKFARLISTLMAK